MPAFHISQMADCVTCRQALNRDFAARDTPQKVRLDFRCGICAA